MNKIIKLAVLIIAAACTVGCSSMIIGVDRIDIINLRTEEKSTVIPKSQTGKLINEAIKQSKKINRIPIEPDFEIVLNNKNGTDDSYFFTFNYDDQKTYIIKDDDVFEVKEYVSKKFYLNDDFVDLYVNNTIPEVTITQNKEIIRLPGRYRWTFRRVNNSYFEREGTLKADNNIIKINDADQLSLSFDIDPDNYIFKLYDNGEIVRTGKSFEDVIGGIGNDGQYYVELAAQWKEKLSRDCYGEQNISFVADIDLPTELIIVSEDNYPGNSLAVFIKNSNENDTLKISCTASGVTTDIYEYGDGYINIMPIGLNVLPGEYEVICTVNEGSGSEYKVTKTFTVNEKSFKTQYLEVAQEISEQTRTQQANAEYAKYVKNARSTSVDEKLWQDNFIMPIDGILTTDFAEIRYVNDEKSSSRHSGIDLAAPRGTAIKASNTGRVALAKYVTLTGNTIVIDHGMGLFTTYYHLDTLAVSSGDEIEKGQIIGTVGSTGFSTGPHLHFTFSIYNNYCNPYQPIVGLFELEE